MQIGNYPLMKNYLILLSFMIFSGRVVSPFDVDCRQSKLPKIPACLQVNWVTYFLIKESSSFLRETSKLYFYRKVAYLNTSKAKSKGEIEKMYERRQNPLYPEMRWLFWLSYRLPEVEFDCIWPHLIHHILTGRRYINFQLPPNTTYQPRISPLKASIWWGTNSKSKSFNWQ